MGKQYGPLEIRGVIGGMQFGRNSDGSPGVKKARRFSLHALKVGKNYARTRDNNAEFTGSARATHGLRLALGERVRLFADRLLTARLMALTYRVLAKGPGAGGSRTFEVGPNAVDFRNLELSASERFRGRFQAPFTLAVNPDRNVATVDVPAFDTDYQLRCPNGATHYRLILVAGSLSDYAYTGQSDVYAAVNPGLAGLTSLVESGIAPALGVVQPQLQLVASLPGSPVLPSSAGLVVSLGVEFFRMVNSQAQLLASGNAMQVVGVH